MLFDPGVIPTDDFALEKSQYRKRYVDQEYQDDENEEDACYHAEEWLNPEQSELAVCSLEVNWLRVDTYRIHFNAKHQHGGREGSLF
jgi:hypothetical protein